MAWNVKEEQKELDWTAFFKKATVPDPNETIKRGLKISMWGGPETGKTYFCCSMSEIVEPVFIIDTEYGARKVAKRHFPGKEIHVYEVRIAEKDFETIDFYESIKEIEQAIHALRNVSYGAICIDSVSDIYGWLNAWTEATATKKISTKTGAEYIDRLDWQKRNEKYRNMILRLVSRPVHVCYTAQPQSIYSKDGKETGDKEARWLDPHPHWSDVVLTMRKLPIDAKTIKYIATIDKCREERAYNMIIEDVTFKKLLVAMRDKLALKVDGIDYSKL